MDGIFAFVVSLVLSSVNCVIQFQCNTEHCLNQQVEYQCIVTGSFALIWRIRDPNVTTLDTESHTSSDVLSSSSPFDNAPQFSSDLSSKSPSLISNISFTVQSSINGYTILCEGQGGDNKNCTINIAGIPNIASIGTFTNSSVNISWSVLPSLCVTEYRYNATSDGEVSISNMLAPNNTIQLQGLVPSNSTQCVIIYGVDDANRIGVSTSSYFLFNVPPGVDIINVNSDRGSFATFDVTVKWTIMETNVGNDVVVPPLNGYEVFIFNTTNHGIFANESGLLAPETTSFTFIEVPEGRNYTVEIFAVNDIGRGRSSSRIFDVPLPSFMSTQSTEPSTVSPTVSQTILDVLVSPSNIATVTPTSLSITTITSATTTESSTTTDSTTDESTGDVLLPIIGVVVAVVVVAVIVIILAIIACYVHSKKRSYNKTSVDLLGVKGGSSGDPIPLRERPLPETGQALYQDPTTIERKQAPTGDMYALPDKPRRQPPRPGPSSATETATYQDPNTIERQQAPTGDTYALPQKKPQYSKVDKANKGSPATYAELGFEDGNQPPISPSGQPLIPQDKAQVMYADVRGQ